jgi:ankyrin repeat protein
MVLGTPLHWAAYYGQLEVIKYFVEVRKCPVNIKNHHNQTPLQLARENGHTNIVEYLSSFV